MAKIYISSTYKDLIEYREIIYKSLRKMGHDVIAMEDYVANDTRPVEKCLSDVEKCDIYVGIFAWRYGFVPEGYEFSITEQEYRSAKTYKIPRLIFLLEDNAFWTPGFMDSHTGEGEAGKRINSLRNELKNEHMVSFFDGKVDLAVDVAIAIYKLEKEKGLEKHSQLWEYVFTIDLLKTGLSSVEKQFSDLQRGLMYRTHQTKSKSEILEWIRQKLDDLVVLIALLKNAATDELMTACGKPGQSGDEEAIRDAVTKIIDGCKGLLEWEIDLTFTRFPNGFENIKNMMQGWTYDYMKVIKRLYEQMENIVSDSDAEGTYKVNLVFESPRGIEDIVPEMQKILGVQSLVISKPSDKTLDKKRN
jgi:hypothetical protein